jgi:hypothetical protein
LQSATWGSQYRNLGARESGLYAHFGPLLGRYFWDRGVFEDTPVEEFHDVEVAAYNAFILAECVGLGHGDVGLLEGMDDPVFAIDLVGCLQNVSIL